MKTNILNVASHAFGHLTPPCASYIGHSPTLTATATLDSYVLRHLGSLHILFPVSERLSHPLAT